MKRLVTAKVIREKDSEEGDECNRPPDFDLMGQKYVQYTYLYF